SALLSIICPAPSLTPPRKIFALLQFFDPPTGGGWEERRSLPPEHRFSFFHEGGAAFLVVLAGEAAGDERLAFFFIEAAGRFREFVHDLLCRVDGQGRILGDDRAIVANEVFQRVPGR